MGLQQWKESRNIQPRMGRKSLAQRFNAGVNWDISQSPVGTKEVATQSLQARVQPHFFSDSASADDTLLWELRHATSISFRHHSFAQQRSVS